MSLPDHEVRRATLDDLQSLVALWNSMRLPVIELERRLTEFQVVVATNGAVLGAIGMQIHGRQGRIHSEGFNDFAMADELRDRLWARFQSVATNHGLTRIWTQETAPFWKQNGFSPTTEEELKRLPEDWAASPGDWATLKLRDEELIEATLDKEFARFMEAEKLNTQRALGSARAMKNLATVLAIILALFVGYFALNAFMHGYIRLPGR